MYDYTFKMCIFGDGGVGKTTLTTRYLKGLFKPSITMTIGTNFYNKEITLNGKSILLQIWDFGGERQYRTLFPTYVNGSSGAIFMYDITRFSSLKNATEWMDTLKEGLEEPIPIIAVGGKLDLENNRTVKLSAIEEVVKQHSFLDHIECSSKTGERVEEVFIKITQTMLDNSIK